MIPTPEFNTRLNQLSNILQSFAYKLTKDSEEAKDLFQETAFRALKNHDKFRDGTNFKAWLFTIMKNIFINNYRRKIKNRTIIDTTDNMYYINTGGSQIVNKGESNMMLKELRIMIEDLEQQVQVPFMMHYRGYKYKEIAETLDIPVGTVKSRIFFARKTLKAQIQRAYVLN